MGLFRRRATRAADPRPAIANFWSWWAEHRADVVKALEEDRTDDVLGMLDPAVAAIDERLSCEVVPTENKRFGLVISSAGEPRLRATAERWRIAAPDDPDVDFFSTRRRTPAAFQSTMLKIDGYDFAMSELMAGVRVDSSSGKVDVVVHHPLFTLVDHDHRLRVTFLGLDAAIGEDSVQRWVGAIDVSVDAPIDAIPLSSLENVVEQLRSPGGGGEWAAMEGRGPRGPVFAIIRRAASPHTHPLADTHVAVVLVYDAADNGMPADPSISTDIEKLESRVVEALGGESPQVVHVGHITGAGQVVAHFYVDGLDVDPEAARAVLGTWRRGRSSIVVSHDPAWEHVAAFMG